jgi:hypothetical protein
MAAATKKKRKEEAYPWKAGANSGHMTNLKQSILETFNIYGPISKRYSHSKGPDTVFTILHFLRNLLIGPIS